MKEDEDFVICQICKKRYKAVNNTHLKKHNITTDTYRDMFPSFSLTSISTCKKHVGVINGDKNPMKRSDVREKVSASMRKRYESEEVKDIARELFKKKKEKMLAAAHTKEANEKRRKSLIGHKVSKEAREKIRISKLGDRNPSKRDEVRKKNSEWHKKYGTYGRGKKRPSMTGSLNPMKCNSVKRKHLEAVRSFESRKKVSESSKKQWDNPDYIKKIMLSLHTGINKSESKLLNLITSIMPGEYVYNGDFSHDVKINRKIPDFVNINGKMKVIELYGDYFHRGENPNDRIELFKTYGWDCMVIWESELLDVERVIDRILTFHGLPSCCLSSRNDGWCI